MLDPATHWRRVAGDGCAYDGPCIVRSITFWPDSDADYVDVYDGRDTKSGEKYCRIETAASTTKQLNFGQGVRFGRGIYFDGIDSAVETAVSFIPLDE